MVYEKYVPIGIYRHEKCKISNYVLLKISDNSINAVSIPECKRLINNGQIVGLMIDARGTIKFTRYFKHKGVVGEKSESNEVYTIIKQYIDKTTVHFEISDTIGQTKIVGSDDLIEMMNGGALVNGAVVDCNRLLISKEIPCNIGGRKR